MGRREAHGPAGQFVFLSCVPDGLDDDGSPDSWPSDRPRFRRAVRVSWRARRRWVQAVATGSAKAEMMAHPHQRFHRSSSSGLTFRIRTSRGEIPSCLTLGVVARTRLIRSPLRLAPLSSGTLYRTLRSPGLQPERSHRLLGSRIPFRPGGGAPTHGHLPSENPGGRRPGTADPNQGRCHPCPNNPPTPPNRESDLPDTKTKVKCQANACG